MKHPVSDAVDMAAAAEQLYNDPDRIPVTKILIRFSEILKEIQMTNRRKYITKNGRAVAVIAPLVEAAIVDDVRNKNTLIQGER